MARRFALITKDFQDFATDLAGVSKDNLLDEDNPTLNYGITQALLIKEHDPTDSEHVIVESAMPLEEDIIGFDELVKVELLYYFAAVRVDMLLPMTVAFVGLDPEQIWDEGTKNGSAGASNWDDAQSAVPWKNGGGAIKSDFGSIDDAETIYDTVIIPGFNDFSAGFRSFDLTPFLNMGDIKTGVLFCLAGTSLNKNTTVYSREYVTASLRPIIRLTYRNYPPEGFKDEAERLKIAPYENNPVLPILTWGGIDDVDFLQYKIYRDTSPITSVDGFKSAITAVAIATDKFTIAGEHGDAFPVGSTFKVTGSTGNNGRWTVKSVVESGTTVIETEEDITDATVDGDIHHGIYTTIDNAIEEFVDPASLTNGTTYYYRLIAEDVDNHEDNALRSATVFFTKPDVTTATLSPSGTQNVGTNVSVTVVSPQNIKKVFVNWKDDTVTPANDVQAWYEFETVALTQVASHIYTKHTNAGSVTPQVRIEDENGFWSDLESTGNTVRLDDVTPKAKLLVSVHKAIEGDDVTLNGAYSQPAASNATITKYEFKRFAADTWQDNGTDPIFTFSTSGFGTGTITASLRITTSTSLQDTDTTTYDLETGTPTEITPGVVGGLSNYTSIHELDHGLGQSKLVELPTGSDGVEHEFLLARKAERITIHATSDFPGRDADITIIRNAWLNNTFLRLVVPSEMDGFSVQYDFKLDGDVSLGHRFDNKLNWSFPIRVITRTEIADSPLNGAITAFSNPGGGKVQATSANHGLLNGMYVLITGTLNYDGTYQISNVTTNTFRFVATWVADDAMGLWRKVGEG